MNVKAKQDDYKKKYGFSKWDVAELSRGKSPVTVVPLYPKPIKKFRLTYQTYNQSIEEIYFWMLGHMRDDWGLYDVKKITDIFAASEQSSFWGQAQQRLQIQQQQVMTYMQSIGKLVKELFQLVRELRVIDERIMLYDESFKQLEKDRSDRKGTQAAEIVLRGYWVDLKDGGSKSPSSVYGMASQVGFAILPDLFFGAPVLKNSEVDKYVDKLEFNRKVREVLKRKLKSFVVWKDATFKELANRRRFTIKYLGQHYAIINMYISWVRPYMKNVRRLSSPETASDSEDLIGAFEGAHTEIEVMCSRNTKGKYHAVIIANWKYLAQPQMDFNQGGYQHKGPIHVGRTEINLRGYSWTQKDLDNYVKMRQEENLELVGGMDGTLKAAVEALGDDLKKYLKELEEEAKTPEEKEEEEKVAAEEAKKKKKKEPLPGLADPFVSIFKGFKEIGTAFFPTISGDSSKGPSKQDVLKDSGDKKSAQKEMELVIWNTYKNFKKSHRMLSW